MPTISTETEAPVAGDKIQTVRKRIQDGYYTRPEVRRTLAELLRLHLLGSRRPGKRPTPKRT